MIPGMGLLYMGQGQKKVEGQCRQREGGRGRCMGTGEGQVRQDLRRTQLSKLQYTHTVLNWCRFLCSHMKTSLTSLLAAIAIYYYTKFALSCIHLMITRHTSFLNRLWNTQTISEKWSEPELALWDINLKCGMFCQRGFLNNLSHLLWLPMSECCPTSSCSFPSCVLWMQKRWGERKLISNKRLTEWLLFCLGHVVLHTCQVLCIVNPPGPRALWQGARWKASGGPSKGPLRSGHEQDRGPQCGRWKFDTLWQKLHTAHSGPRWQPCSQEIRRSLIHFYWLTTCWPQARETEKEMFTIRERWPEKSMVT